MRNVRPIFLNAFSRGGSSLVWNVLQSHPALASPGLETHECFIGTSKTNKLMRNLAFDLRFGPPRMAPRLIDGFMIPNNGLFNPSNMSRRRLSPACRTMVDEALFDAKLATLRHVGYRYRTEDEVYDEAELRETRLVLKNINGIVWLSGEFASMYPDATFIGLVRDGISLCESRMRRRTFPSARKFGLVYRLTIEEMLRQAEEIPNYHIVRFEDFLGDPRGFIDRLFELVGEDASELEKIRLKAKAHYRGDEGYGTQHKAGDLYWMDLSEIRSFVNPDIDTAQRTEIGAAERDAFLDLAGPAMVRLGYV